MNHFTTPKGTQLPFLNLQGKDYLQVTHRLVWFREEHPDWAIRTAVVKIEPEIAVFEARISNPDGIIIASAHGTQLSAKFPAYIEKAESKAVGRALAFIGYGTAHAQELDDSDDIADSPLHKATISPILPTTIPQTQLSTASGSLETSSLSMPFSEAKATDAQRKMLWAVSKSNKLEEKDYRDILKSFGYESSLHIKAQDVNKIKLEIENRRKK